MNYFVLLNLSFALLIALIIFVAGIQTATWNVVRMCVEVVVEFVFSGTSIFQYLCNPTFSLIRPSYEVQSPY